MKGHYRKFPVKSRDWSEILDFYKDFRPGMFEFVAWLRDSEYAFALYGGTSLDSLLIGQSKTFEYRRDVIRLRDVGGKFALTYHENENAESTREFERIDLIPAFEKLLASLHWFRKEEF